MDNITAFLPSWKRHENVRLIIPALRAQTVNPKIVLINTGDPYEGPEPDEVWQVPFPTGPFIKFQIAAYYDGYLYFNDDDILPRNTRLIGQMLWQLRMNGDKGIVGAKARDVWPNPPHYKHGDTRGPWTNNIKMGCAIMHRTALELVRTPPFDMPHRCDDIHVSLEIGRGEGVHYVNRAWASMILDLDGCDRPGFCKEPEHYDEREGYCARWMKENWS